MKLYLSPDLKLLSLLILWRIISVFVVQTAHVPDEYWQSLEVAHHIAFGYGYLTWEWEEGIRSYLYPSLIAILYRILATVSLDTPYLLVTLPRIFQAILVGYSDYRFYHWTGCKMALLVLCTNWYWYYCATRTLINSVETALTIIALSIFPWRDYNSTKYLWIACFLCMARPTAIIIWAPICIWHVFCRTPRENEFYFVFKYGAICSWCFSISVLIDSQYYGKFVITLWNFLKISLSQVPSLYGEHHLLWYFFFGIPTLLGVYCIPFVVGIWYSRYYRLNDEEKMIYAILFITPVVYSFIAHKEFRFILPLLPLYIHVSTNSFWFLNKILSLHKRRLIAVLLIWNLVPGIYFSLIHQRGTLDMMKYLQNEVPDINNSSISFLTPCHATPMYSYLHVDADLRFIICRPFERELQSHEYDANSLFNDTKKWFSWHYSNRQLPTYVIMFDNLAKKTGSFLANYKMITKIFYTHFPQDDYGEYILLYKRLT